MLEPTQDIQHLLQHLVRMQLAGLSWMDALQIWRDNCSPTKRRAIDQIMQRLRMGQSLSDALSRGGWLKGAPLALSRAAETSGIWAVQMQAWLQQTDQFAQLLRQIRSAMAYPLLVLCVTLAVISSVLIWVLPVFASLYEQMHADLPWATIALLQTRQAVVQWGLGFISSILLAVAACLFSLRHAQARLWWDRCGWLAPVFGRWRQMHTESKWCALLSRLIEAGQDWASALELAGRSVGSPVMAHASGRIQMLLSTGQPLSMAMDKAHVRMGRIRRPVFSPMLTKWAKAAEASGTLPQILQQWARLQADMLGNEWSMACRLLEPILMGSMGLLMGWLVLALYLPVLQMGQIM